MGDLSHYIKEVRSNKALKGPAGGLPESVVRHFLKQLGIYTPTQHEINSV